MSVISTESGAAGGAGRKILHTDEVRSIPLFEEVPPSPAEPAMLAARITLPAGKVIARQGELAHAFFVIVDGFVDVIRDDRVVADLGPGDFFGEIGLLSDPRRTATVAATSEVDLVVIARKEFRNMLARFPDFASTVLSEAARRVTANLLEAAAA